MRLRRRARAALAARLGVDVGELPRWTGAPGAPDGPRVRLRSTDSGSVPAALLLPWPDGEPAAAGERVVAEGEGSWAVADAGPADRSAADGDPADALWPDDGPLAEEGPQQVLRAFLDSPDGGFTVAFSPW